MFLVVLHARSEADGIEDAALDFHAVKRAEQRMAFRVMRVQRDGGFKRVDGIVHGGTCGMDVRFRLALDLQHPVKRGGALPVAGCGGFRFYFGGLLEVMRGFGETPAVPCLECRVELVDACARQLVRRLIRLHDHGGRQNPDCQCPNHVLTELYAIACMRQTEYGFRPTHRPPTVVFPDRHRRQRRLPPWPAGGAA